MTTAADLEAWERGGGSFDFRGHRVFVREHGPAGAADAPALLLVHGFPTSSWDWAPLWERLGRGHRLLAPDLLGFGFSAKPWPHRYSIGEQADLVEALLADRGVAEAHVLAHDYGDTVAQELVARDVDRRAAGEAGFRHLSLALLNGGLFPETHQARPMQRLLVSPVGPLLARAMSRRSFGKSFSAIFGPATRPSAGMLDAYWSQIEREGGRRVIPSLLGYMAERRAHRERWVGALVRCPVPLRVIDGTLDPVSGEPMVDRYEQLVPDPDAVRLEHVGHYPQVEDPDAVLAAYEAFRARPPA